MAKEGRSIRLGTEAWAKLDDWAAAYRISRTQVIRVLLSVAFLPENAARINERLRAAEKALNGEML